MSELNILNFLTKIFSRAWFRSTDLWVMGPARFHCATLLSVRVTTEEVEWYRQDHHYDGIQKRFVRSGIRTHAHRSGLRPERSALDLSAILTVYTQETSPKGNGTVSLSTHLPNNYQAMFTNICFHQRPFSSVG